VSANAQKSNRLASLKAGFTNVLAKPFVIKDVVKVLEEFPAAHDFARTDAK
jgi:CheY-like chemotaxis protein